VEPLTGLSTIHIEQLDPDALQANMENIQAPPNFFTVPANTMAVQSSYGVNLPVSYASAQLSKVMQAGQGEGGSYAAQNGTHANQIAKKESQESDAVGEALDTVDQMLEVGEKSSHMAAKIAGFGSLPGNLKNVGSTVTKAALKSEAAEAAEVLKEVSKEAEDAMKPFVKAANRFHLGGNIVSVGSSVLDVTKAKNLNDGIRIVAEDSSNMVAEEAAGDAGAWIGGAAGALLGFGGLDAVTIPAGMWIGGVLGVLAYNAFAKDSLKSLLDKGIGIQPPGAAESPNPSTSLPVTSAPNE
jgi:hypothetical protein